MDRTAKVMGLRDELVDLERKHKKLSFEESVKRLEKVKVRLDPILDEHEARIDNVQAELGGDGIDPEKLKEFAEANNEVVRLQTKYYEVQTLIAAFHAPESQ